MAWRGVAWHGAPPPGLCVCAVHYRGSSMKSLNDRLSLYSACISCLPDAVCAVVAATAFVWLMRAFFFFALY